MKKIFRVGLWVITIIGLISIFAISIISGFSSDPVFIDVLSYFVFKRLWMLLLLLPLSIGNILYASYLKKNKEAHEMNMVVGIVCSIIFLSFGALAVFGQSRFSDDKSYLYKLEEKVEIDFPNEFSIVTQDWTGGHQTSSGSTLLSYVSVVKFDEAVECEFSDKWVDEVQKEDVPDMFYFETSNYEKFLIYCFDTKEYNPDVFSNKYDYVVIGYDYENNNLLIYEYYFK